MHTRPAFVIHLPELTPSRRHAIAFAMFDFLDSGQALQICDDADMHLLRRQFESRNPRGFSWGVLENGPQHWRVRLTKTDIVADDSFACCSGGACGG